MKQNNVRKKKPANKNFLELLENYSKNKICILFLLLILGLVYIANYSAIYDKKLDSNGDNIYYFSLGKALSEGHGYTNTMYLEESPHSHFPPGYPAFVSLILKICPNDIQAVKTANGVLFFISIVLLFFIILEVTDHSILAFGVALLATLHKELLRSATIMMSEMLYITLSMITVLLAILILKWDVNTQKKWKFIVAIGLLTLLVSYIYFVRSMGLSIILALIAWIGILCLVSLIKWIKARKEDDSALVLTHKRNFLLQLCMVSLMILSVGTSVVSWSMRNKNIGAPTSTYKSGFMMKTNGEVMSTKEDWMIRIKDNTKGFVARYIPQSVLFIDYDSKTPVTKKDFAKGCLLLLLFLFGTLYVKRGRLFFIFYAIFTVGVLILYPEQYAGLRYIVPIIPFFIFYFLNGASAIVAFILKLCKAKFSPWILQCIVILCLVFGLLQPTYSKAQENERREAKLKSWKGYRNESLTNFILATEWCKDSLPDNARLICRKPEIFYMFSGFKKSSSFPYYGEPDTIYNFLKKNKIDYLLIDSWFKHAYSTLIPCVSKYPDKFKVIKEYKTADEKKNPSTYILKFNDEWGYTGDLVDGVREGQGTLLMQDGRRYTGSFSHGEPNGFGILYDADSNIVAKGNWTNGICYH